MGMKMKFKGFLDVDWVGDNDERKFTFDYLFKLGRSLITWCLEKKLIITLN